MAGITGFWQENKAQESTLQELKEELGEMLAPLPQHGGAVPALPSHQWFDPAAGVASGGHSPAWGRAFCGGRYHLSWQGHITNLSDVRRQLVAKEALDGRAGAGEAGTIAAAIASWGVYRAARFFDGAFVFALWDGEAQCLSLGRDRHGALPLFYQWREDGLFWASTFSSLRVCQPGAGGASGLNGEAMALLLRHQCLPAPYTTSKGVFKVAPSTIITVESGGGSSKAPREASLRVRAYGGNLGNFGNGGGIVPQLHLRGGEVAYDGGVAKSATFWCPTLALADASASTLSAKEVVVERELAGQVARAVGARLAVVDQAGEPARPVAVMWSGLPSQVLLTVMARRHSSSRALSLWSVVAQEGGQDGRAATGRRLAEEAGAEYRECVITPEALLALLPQLPSVWEQPMLDASMLAPLFIARGLHGSATLLSHAGADVFFREEAWRSQVARAWRVRERFPEWLLAGSGREAWGAICPSSGFLRNALQAPSNEIFYRRSLAQTKGLATLHTLFEVGKRGALLRSTLAGLGPRSFNEPFGDTVLLYDLLGMLPEAELAPLAQACGHYGVEVLHPFLDHQLIALALEVGGTAGMGGKSGKRRRWAESLLHRIAQKECPHWRPNRGSQESRESQGSAAGPGSLPLDAWLRGPLRSWGEELLGEMAESAGGNEFYRITAIREQWAAHQAGRVHAGAVLWAVLMVQLWQRHRGGAGQGAQKAAGRGAHSSLLL